MNRKLVSVLLICLFVVALAVPAGAQDMMMGEPSVEVADQVSVNGTVVITSAYSDGPGFVVIHIDNGSGGPGPVAGNAALNPGWNYNIPVSIDTSVATPMLFAMLHADTGEVGVYEFGTVEGADGPVRDGDDNVITPGFNVDLISASDQMVDGSSVTISNVVAQADGWLVVHAGDAESFGAVLGQTQVTAGANSDVVVELSGDMTPVLWPMLHVDTGEAGVYEFGSVEGADGPVAVNGAVATLPIWTTPHIRVADQIAVHGDGMEMMDMAPVVMAHSVLAEVDGWLVIHAGDSESFGAVLGQTQVSAGLNENVEVELSGDITPILWPMLHVDTGEAGVYEFGTVEGADGPVVVDGEVVTFPINAAPSIDLSGSLEGDVLTVNSALIDGAGWLAIHSNNEGAPGPVIGTAPLRPGLNTHIMATLSEDPGDTVFPMLHYDTGEAGVYEFGTVEGADGPVSVGGSVVVGSFDLSGMMMEDMGEEMMDDMTPSIDYTGSFDGTTLVVNSATIDAPGWLAIHDDNDGGPGPVIGFAPLVAGVNSNIEVVLDSAPSTDTVFPMLHYDTGEAGVYEFGTVEGADGPVRVDDAVVVGPFDLTGGMMEEMPSGCTVTAGNQTINLRGGAGTNFNAVGALEPSQTADAVGQAQGADGFTWFTLSDGSWVRSDVVLADGACDSLPVVGSPEAPAAPEATEEASS